MPPWKPVAPGVGYRHERRLSAVEIATLQAWVAGGAARGPSVVDRNLPPVAVPAPDREWRVLEPFEVPAQGQDLYRCFVIPSRLDEARWIDGFEFTPGNRVVVHHALVFFDLSGAGRRLDAEAEGPGYPCFGTPGFLPVASLGGWSPGNRRLTMPPGTAVRAPKGADIVLQIHYHPTGKLERDQSGVRVYFAKSPPQKRLLDIALTSNRIDIAAGLAKYQVHDYFEVPVDVTLWQIIPHAHFVARRVRAWAVLPGGVRKAVLTITDWDFNWQDIYQLKAPLRLPAGTLLEMEIDYDNSTANPRNPNQPPQRVSWGPGSGDEMAGVHWNVTVDNEERDLEDLTSSLWGKMIRATQTGKPRR